MTRSSWITATIRCLAVLTACSAAAQAQAQLTLRQAEAAAIQNHPRLKVAQLTAQAASETPVEIRSALMPNLFSSFTGVGALDNSRIAAGGLNNPIIYDRLATGVSAGQLITDFGRTSTLVQSADLHAMSQERLSEATKDQLVFDVSRAYFSALRSQAVLRVASQTVEARKVVLDQVTELAANKLKSELDVTFAKVNVADAELLQLNAQNELRAAYAELSQAMGDRNVQQYRLVEEPMPGTLPPNPEDLVSQALQARPDISAFRLERDSAARFSKAEHSLWYPSISAVMSLGIIPVHSAPLSDRYGALGFNISIPVFNGKLYNARQKEADIKARASEERLADLSNTVSRDVTVAWLRANTAFQRIALTGQLLDQSRLALELAQTRYDLGLSSIVELTQAQLGQTSAEIASASAKYDYQLQRSVLDYQMGVSP
jgi:outer membrane protein